MNGDGSSVLDARRLRGLFAALSARLAAESLRAQLFVVGGAAMALAYDTGRVTRDVDALFEPAARVREVAATVGDAYGLETDWLNDAAKGYLPGRDDAPRAVFESESLLVQVASARYLLAMKLLAARDDRDLDDAAMLFNRVGVTTGQDGIDILAASYPAALLLPRHNHIVVEVARRAALCRGTAAGDTAVAAPAMEPPSHGQGIGL